MMSEPMSDERLAELRANVERAEENTKWYGPLGYNGEMERDCLGEIDRLRAEVKRLHQSVVGERMFKESERQWKGWANEAGAKVTQELEAMKAENETFREALNHIQRLPTGNEGRGPLIAQAVLTLNPSPVHETA